MARLVKMFVATLAALSLVGLAASQEAAAEAAACASSPGGCEAGEDASLMQLKSPSASEGKEKCGPRLASTTAEYVGCWEDGEFCCVSNKLFGSVMSPDSSPNATVYPTNRSFAWYGSSDDLQTALQLRKKFGAGSAQITIGIQVAVGFNPLSSSWADEDAAATDPGFFFLVLEQPESVSLVTPTFAEWFNIYTQLGFNFAYDAVKETLLTYANLGKNGAPFDVLQAWVKLTGCSRECSAPLAGNPEISRECNCNTPALLAWDVVSPWMEDETPGNSEACFQALFDKYPKPCATMLRVAFHACNDMLPIYAGLGLGYNTIVSPLLCNGPWSCRIPVNERYGGREFVMPNLQLWELNNTGTARQIPLSQVPEGALNSPTLTDKFC